MSTPSHALAVEEHIDQWRSYLRRRQAIQPVDVAELEDHLREQIATLTDAGLAPDEAFLVAVKRIGSLDALSREFAREHSERLWKQLVVSVPDTGESGSRVRKDAIVAFALAIVAAALVKMPALFGIHLNPDQELPAFYFRNASLFVFPPLTLYFVWKRGADLSRALRLALPFLAAATIVNLYPFHNAAHLDNFPKGSDTQLLAGLHLPIALWLAVGVAYAARRWSQVSGRMDFIRFTGELAIYYVLIAMGGGVLTGFMALIFQSIGINIAPFFATWLLPCGAAGAVLVASWLVEAKQSVIENMAPVLTRLFTPLFTAVLIAFLVAMLWTGRGVDVAREVLIAFDLLLVVVLGLHLYSISARDPRAPVDIFDMLQVALVVSALAADAVALWAIASRISELGFTPNRVAALGENVILLVNLAWSARLYVRVLRNRGAFDHVEKWQTDYLPVYAIWAAIVVIVFPPMFGFL
jgi:hypothetical protein